MATQRKNRRMKGKTYIATAGCIVLVGVLIVLVISNHVLAKKPGSGGSGGPTEKWTGCVTVDESSGYAVVTDGYPNGDPYCDSKSEHIIAGISRDEGRFVLDTNTNNSGSGRTMTFTFDNPVDGQQADEGSDPLFNIQDPVTPIAVRMKTARSLVAEYGGRGYVDLRAMEEGDQEFITAQIELIVTDEQHAYILHYRSDSFSENDPDNFYPGYADTDFLTVTRTSSTMWTIQSSGSAKAMLQRRLGWGEIHDVGIFDVPIKLEIELQ